MLGYGELPGVGAVGGKLLYPDGRIQHAGVVLGMHGLAGHVFRSRVDTTAPLEYGAYAHVARSDNFSPEHWALGATIAPDARPGGTARHAVLEAALAYVRSHGGGRVVYWVLGAQHDDDAALADGAAVIRGVAYMKALEGSDGILYNHEPADGGG